MSALTAKDMIDLLRGHYIAPRKPAGGYFAPELTAPNSARRGDLIWLPLTSQDRGRIIGHEVKVSRADVVQELADPTKADAWAQFCSQWWLVVSAPELVAGLSVPDHWGIMAPPSGRLRRTMTVLRPAPELRPQDRAEALAAIMSRMFFAGDDVAARLADAEQRAERAKVDAEAWQDRYRDAYSQLSALGEISWERELTAEVVREISRLRVGELHRYARPNASTIAQAALDHAAVEARTAEMIRRLESGRRQIEQMQDFSHLTEKLTGMRRRIEEGLAELSIGSES